MANKNEEMCVYSTTDYDTVKHINGNRIVNPRNVEVLALSMTQEQLVVPAIVNEKMEIIDGQHRLAACKQLNIPFYYIIVHGYNLRHVQVINANMKNWTTKDFLESFIDLYKLGNTEYYHYVELQDFLSATELELSTSIVLSDTSKPRKDIDDDFKHGRFKFVDLEKTLDLASALKEFQVFNDKKWKMTTFAKVFSSLYYYPGYDHSRMMRNMTKNFHLMELMGNERSTRQYLLEVYNFNSRSKSKIYVDSLLDYWKGEGEGNEDGTH